MQIQVAAENKLSNNWINKQVNLYLFYNDTYKYIYPVLFLLLLFYNEAGNAFVESPLNRTTKINIKNPGQKAGILVFPQPLRGVWETLLPRLKLLVWKIVKES